MQSKSVTNIFSLLKGHVKDQVWQKLFLEFYTGDLLMKNAP